MPYADLDILSIMFKHDRASVKIRQCGGLLNVSATSVCTRRPSDQVFNYNRVRLVFPGEEKYHLRTTTIREILAMLKMELFVHRINISSRI
jgi:hypothetical protein